MKQHRPRLLTVEQLIERLQELPGYYITDAYEVAIEGYDPIVVVR